MLRCNRPRETNGRCGSTADDPPPCRQSLRATALTPETDPIGGSLLFVDVWRCVPKSSCERMQQGALQEAGTYSITSVASASSSGGIVRPSALAVLRLMTNSSFVDCSTGKPAGLAPLKTLST